MQKDTSNLLEALKSCSDFKQFYCENEECIVSVPLSTLLDTLLTQHNIKKSAAIRRSELSEDYAYQIFSGLRVPERKKLLSLAICVAGFAIALY